jgi:DNA-binding NtrC family response regulator
MTAAVPQAHRVLVVDDDAQVLSVLEQALDRRGYAVSVAADAESALELLKRTRYDLVLMDVRLPGMNGLEAVEELQKIDRRTPVIVMTALTSRDIAVDAVSRGAYDYCRKPFRVDDIEIVMQRALARRRLVADLEALREQLAAGGPCLDDPRHLTLGERVGLLERAFVLDALTRSGGVQAAAARLLGVSERSMWHLVKKHGIEVERMKKVGAGSER